MSTTRKHYAPVLASRLKQASESLAGRFQGWKPDDASLATDESRRAAIIAADIDGRIH